MNKYNLIKLGAFAQKEFDMQPDFEIMEFAPDAHPRVRIAFNVPALSQGLFARYDEVELKKYGNRNNFETIWIGYSERANILCIKKDEPE